MAYPACVRTGSAQTWRRRDATSMFEELPVPYAMSFTDATAACAAVGGYLGTITKSNVDSLSTTIRAITNDEAWVGLLNDCSNNPCTVKWRGTNTPYDGTVDVPFDSNPSTSTTQLYFKLKTDKMKILSRSASGVAPFVCSRRLLSVSLQLVSMKCYVGITCTVRLAIESALQSYHMDVATSAASYTVNIGSASTAISMTAGQSTRDVSGSVGTVGTTTVTATLGAGYGVVPNPAALSVTINALEELSNSAVPQLYADQSGSFSLVKPTSDAVTVTLSAGSTYSGQVTVSAFVGNTATVTLLSTVAQSAVLQFTVSGPAWYATSYGPVAVQTLARQNIAVAIGPPAYVMGGEMFQLRIRTPIGSLTPNAQVSFTASPTGCATIAPAMVQWGAGAVPNATRNTNVTGAASPSGTSTCTVVMSLTHVAFLAPPQVPFTLNEHLTLSTPAVPPFLALNQVYTFATSVPRVYEAATVTPTCGSLVFTPTSISLSVSATQTSMSFTTISAVATTCTLSFGISGAGSRGFSASQPTVALTFSSIQYVSLTFISTVYVTQSATVTVTAPQLGALESITGTLWWEVTSGSPFVLSPYSFTLNGSSLTVSVGFTGAATGTGRFVAVFTSVPSSYSSANVTGTIEVRAQQVVSVGAIVTPQAAGVRYQQSMAVSVPALPPLGTVVSVAVWALNTTCLEVVGSPAVWSGSDTSNAAKTISFTASCSSNTSVSYSVTTNTSQYAVVGATSLGALVTYVRHNVNVTPATTVTFGTAKEVELNVTTSAPSVPLVLVVSAPPEDLSVVGGSNVTLSANATSVTVRLTVLRVSSVPLDVSLSLPASQNDASMVPLYETEILPVHVTVLPLRQVSVVCNSSLAYFGNGIELHCNFSVTALPSSGTVSIATPTTSYFTFAPSGTLVFTTMQQRVRMLPVVGAAFNDGDAVTLTFTMTDTSGTFAVASLPVPVTLRRLRSISLTLLNDGALFASNALGSNPIQVVVGAATAISAGTDIVVNVTGAEYTSNVSVVLLNSTMTTMAFSFTTVTAQTLSLRLPVMAPVIYNTMTDTLSLVVRALQQVTMSVEATVLYVGQSTTLSVFLSGAPGADALVVTPTSGCGSAVLISPTQLTFTGATSSGTFNVTAVAPCNPAVIAGVLSGPSTIFDKTLGARTSVTLDIRRRKDVFVTATGLVVYGGGSVGQQLGVTFESQPFLQPGEVKVTIAATPSNVLVLQYTAFSVLDTSSAASLVRSASFTALAVSGPTVVSLDIVLSGSAASEYTLLNSTMTVTALPPVNVSVSLNFSVVYVAPQLSRTFTVSLPVAPASGSVVVTPVFLRGSPTSVQFTPRNATLSASQLSASFVVTALDATTSGEAVSVTFAGTAVEYFPQPAAREYPMTFRPLGVVTVGAVASGLYRGNSLSIPVSVSTLPPAGAGDVTVTVSSSSAAVTLSPTVLRWTSTTGSLAATVTVSGVSVASGVVVSLVLSAPSVFQPTLNQATITLDVLNPRQILWSVPESVYVGLQGTGSVSLAVLPSVGQSLSVAVSYPIDAMTVSTVFDFTSTSPLTQQFTVTGVAPTNGAATMSLSILSGAANYDAPGALSTTIYALETVTVTGMRAAMYAQSTMTLVVTVSRLPTCEGGITITAAFATQDAAFTPAAGVTFVSTDTQLFKSLVLSAVTATAAVVPVTFTVSGASSCTATYSAVAAPFGGVRIFGREELQLRFPAAALSGMSYFVYAESAVTLTVDLGTPAIAHTGVTVVLSYAGGIGAVAFSPSTVTVPAGTNRTTVTVTGGLESDPAVIGAVVTVGSTAFTVGALPVLRVLKRIPVQLLLNPSTQLLVVGNSITVGISVESTSLIGSLIASVSYGPELRSTTVTFDAQSVVLQQFVELTGLSAGSRQLVLSLNGTGGAYYTSSWVPTEVPIRVKRNVTVSGPSEVFIGSANKCLFNVSLRTFPTIATDVVTVVLTSLPTLSLSPSTVTLQTSSPWATVEATGVALGTALLRSAFAVSSTSGEYASQIPLEVSVSVLALLGVGTTGFQSVMPTRGSASFTVTLPRPPSSGSLSVAMTLRGSSYNMTVTPSTLVFGSGETSKVVTMNASDTTLLPTPVDFVTSGSPEFLANARSETVEVVLAQQVALSGWQTSLYVGTANTFTITVGLFVRPTTFLTVSMPSSPNFTVTPSVMNFTTVSALSMTATVRGLTPNGALGENATFALVDPSSLYLSPSVPRLRVLGLETYTGNISSAVVYQGLSADIRLVLSKVPVSPVIVELVLKKNRTGTSTLVDLDPTEYSVSPGVTQAVSGDVTAVFSVQGMVAPLNVLATFRVTGAATVQFFVGTLPQIGFLFESQRPIVVTAPSTLYQGLPGTLKISVPSAPSTGSVYVSLALPPDNSLPVTPSAVTFDSTSPASYTLSVVPVAIQQLTIVVTVQLNNANSYKPTATPSAWVVNVQQPFALRFDAVSGPLYVGNNNRLTLTLRFGTLATGETLGVTLLTNTTAVDVFPSTVECSTTPAVFTVQAPSPVVVAVNISFVPSVNRFVLDPGLKATGLVLVFRPLKPITVLVPTISSPLVGETLFVTVTLGEAPNIGQTLVAELSYSGSPSNVLMSPAVLWDSTTSSLSRTLSVRGLSPTDMQAVTVQFSGDTQYVLTPVSFPLQVIPLLLVTPNLPLSVFAGTPAVFTIALESALPVSVQLRFSPPGAMRLYDSSGSVPLADDRMSWVLNGPVVQSAALVAFQTVPVVVSYNITGPSASKYSLPSSSSVSVLSDGVLLVNAPANDMEVFLSRELSVRVTVSLRRAPLFGYLLVTPTLGCAAGQVVNFSVPVVNFTATSPTSRNIDIIGVRESSPCDLQFPISGTAVGYTGSSARYTVRVRPLNPITMATVDSRLFIGDANRIALNVSLGPQTQIPLSGPVTVTVSAGACLSVSPSTLFWAAASTTEVLTKAAFVTATCATTSTAVTLAVTAPNTFVRQVPESVVFRTVPRLDVAVVDPATSSTDFYVFVASGALYLDVTLPEPLTAKESLAVSVSYEGISSSISVTPAVWAASAESALQLTKKLVISLLSLSPRAPISFVVTGPPRYNGIALGGGYLQIVGPLTVTSTMPSRLFVGTLTTIKVTIQEPPLPGEVIVVRALWDGAPTSLQWAPTELSWTSSTLSLERTLTLNATEYSGGFRFALLVSGSLRFVSSAFDGPVSIEYNTRVQHSGLPLQLMTGRSYALALDIGVLPSSGQLFVQFYAEGVTGVPCLQLSATQISFHSGSGSTSQTVGVTALRSCSLRRIRFTLMGTPAVLLKYDRSVPPRLFETVPRSIVSVDWPLLAYVGDTNAGEAVLTLHEVIYDQAGYVNVTITPDQVNLPPLPVVSWVYGDPAQKTVAVWSYFEITAVYSFTVTTNIAVNATLTPRTTSFLRSITLQRESTPATIFSGDANKYRVYVTASESPQRLGNTDVANFSMVPSASCEEVSFVPSRVTWNDLTSPRQFFYIVGMTPVDSCVLTFDVEGSGSRYVQNWVAPATIGVLPLLVVNYTVPPRQMYVGRANAASVTVTAPDSSPLVLAVLVDGDTSAFVTTPSELRFTGGTRQQTFTLWGVFPTSIVSRMRYRLLDAPSRIVMAPSDPLDTLAVVPLKTITRTPDSSEFVLFVSQSLEVRHVPAPVNMTCLGSTAAVNLSMSSDGGTLRVLAVAPGTASINCSFPDPTYVGLPDFSVRIAARKTITVTAVVETFVNSSVVLRVTLGLPPSGGILSLQPHPLALTNATFSPPILHFSALSAVSQLFTVRGTRVTLGPRRVTFVYSGPVGEFDTSSAAVDLTVLQKFTVTSTTTLQYTNATHALGYEGDVNSFTATFRIPRTTLYDSIYVYPVRGPSGLVRYCLGLPCVSEVTVATPLTLGAVTSGTIVMFAAAASANEELKFELFGGADFGGPPTISLGVVNFRPLERMTVDASGLRRRLYLGAANGQTLRLRISAPPLPGQSVELVVLSPTGVTVSPALVSWFAPSSSSVPFTDPYEKEVRVTGMEEATNATLSVVWRDRTSIVSARNFQTAFNLNGFVFDVVPLHRFRVLTRGEVPPLDAAYTMYLGEVNGLDVDVSVDALPVFATDTAIVNVAVSNPQALASTAPSVLFGTRFRGGALQATVRLWALQTADSITVTFTLTAPPEFETSTTYRIVIAVKSLLELEYTLVQSVVAVGPENAITFNVRPPLPVTVTLGSQVTCTEVSLTALDNLVWDNSMGWKRLTVAATAATTELSNCVLEIPVLDGESASQFRSPPFTWKMSSKARPELTYTVDDEVPSATIRDTGLSVEVGLTDGGYWQWNASTVESMLARGVMSVSSTRNVEDEPQSVLSLLESQLAGLLRPAFFTIVFNAESNTLTLNFGPHPKFAATAREVVSVTLTRGALLRDVSFAPESDTVIVVVRGSKQALIGGAGGSVLGSGTAGAAIAGGTLSTGAATQAGKIESIVNAFLCPNPDWREDQLSLSWSDQLLPMSFGTIDELGTFAAVAISNAIVVMLFAIFHVTLAYIVYRVRARLSYNDKTFGAALAVVHFPSYLLVPVLFFFQNIVSSSVKVLFYSPVMGLRFLAAVTLIIVGFGLPLYTFIIVGPSFRARYVVEESKPATGARRIMRFFVAGGEWMHDDHYWIGRYSMFFDEFREGRHWFMFTDIVLTFALGVVDGYQPITLVQCYGRLTTSVVIFFVQWILVLVLRPFTAPFVNYFFIVAYLLQFLSMTLVAVAVFRREPDYAGTDVSIKLLLLFSGLLMVKALFDILQSLNDHFGMSQYFEAKEDRTLRQVSGEDELREVQQEMLHSLEERFDVMDRDMRHRVAEKGFSNPIDDEARRMVPLDFDAPTTTRRRAPPAIDPDLI